MQPLPPPPTPPKKKEMSRTAAIVIVSIGAVFLLGVFINSLNATVKPGGSTEQPTSDTQDMDKRVCEIARDIGGSFNVTDTLERSQERIADLYSGYGIAASPAIRAALHDWSAGMTSGDYDLAAKGITATSDACAAEGY
jgi:hypothetical protein